MCFQAKSASRFFCCILPDCALLPSGGTEQPFLTVEAPLTLLLWGRAALHRWYWIVRLSTYASSQPGRDGFPWLMVWALSMYRFFNQHVFIDGHICCLQHLLSSLPAHVFFLETPWISAPQLHIVLAVWWFVTKLVDVASSLRVVPMVWSWACPNVLRGIREESNQYT